MTRAIWYRHWLEIRFPVTIAGIAVAPLCLLPLTVVLTVAPRGRRPSSIVRRGSSGHIWSSGAWCWAAASCLGGTGVRTGIAAPRPPVPVLHADAARRPVHVDLDALRRRRRGHGGAVSPPCWPPAPPGMLASRPGRSRSARWRQPVSSPDCSRWRCRRSSSCCRSGTLNGWGLRPATVSFAAVVTIVGLSLGRVISANSEPFALTLAVLSVIGRSRRPRGA